MAPRSNRETEESEVGDFTTVPVTVIDTTAPHSPLRATNATGVRAKAFTQECPGSAGHRSFQCWYGSLTITGEMFVSARACDTALKTQV